MKKAKYSALRAVVITALFLFAAGPAAAHKVTVFAWVENGTVYTESKFSGGRKAQNALVEVYDDRGAKLLEGRTNENGEFTFPVPRKTAMKIVLVAGMGHKGEWTIPLEEVAESAQDSDALQSAEENRPTVVHKAPNAKTEVRETPVQSPYATPEQIEKIVENAMDRKLEPVVKILHRSLNPDKGPTVTDILGGIGYILGLVGVGAYFHCRGKRKGD